MKKLRKKDSEDLTLREFSPINNKRSRRNRIVLPQNSSSDNEDFNDDDYVPAIKRKKN